MRVRAARGEGEARALAHDERTRGARGGRVALCDVQRVLCRLVRVRLSVSVRVRVRVRVRLRLSGQAQAQAQWSGSGLGSAVSGKS